MKETYYQGVNCGRRTERLLSAILNTPVAEVVVNSTDEYVFIGAHGLVLPEQDKYISEVIIKFSSGYSLHIRAWYDFIYVFIRDMTGKIPHINNENSID